MTTRATSSPSSSDFRVGLFAMSGIRALDEQLVREGLTLPGFVERSKTIASLPSLGLLTLAGCSPAGCSHQYVDVPNLKLEDPESPLPSDFDLAAISSFSAQMDEAYALADWLRSKSVKVVLGGLHATSLPEEALEHADAVAVGEGELLWPEIVNDARRGALKRVYKADREFDLADAPMPAFELLDFERYNRVTVQTSRGCPFKCEFCASSILLTRRYKQKPVAKVLAEIDRVLSLWKHPFFELADDNSFVNRAYWKELLPELAKRNIRWFAETDVSVAEDDELLALMRESGCAQVLIGLESPVAEGLDGVELKSNWKARQRPNYARAIERIQSHGISVNGCFVVGLDGHDERVFDQVFDFVRSTGLHEVQATLPTPFPGTPFHARLKAEGRLFEERDWKKCTLFDLNFAPKLMSAETLRAGFRSLIQRLYSDDFVRERKDRFRDALRRAARRGRPRAVEA